MNVRQMLDLYSKSYFHDTTAGGWFDANDAAKEEGRRDAPGLIDNRAVGGYSVPIPEGRDLVRIMIENVEEARDAVRFTKERMERAKRDGLLDMGMFKQQDAETKERWIAAIETVKGDHARAMSEVAHWQNYAEEASRGTLPVLKSNLGQGTTLIRSLADMKSFPPDPRLPPERDEDAA